MDLANEKRKESKTEYALQFNDVRKNYTYNYVHMKPLRGQFMKQNDYFSNWFFATQKCLLAHTHLNVQYHVWELSNEELYDILPQGASDLPEI